MALYVLVLALCVSQEPLFARVYEIEPKQSFLDLGPVVVNENELKVKAPEFLYSYGKKIGADGFIREKRDLEKVYLLNIERDAEWRKNRFKSAVADAAVVALFLVAMGGHAVLPPQSTFVYKTVEYYRAIKFVSSIPAKAILDAKRYDRNIILYLNSLKDREEQLTKLHALFIGGNISSKDYFAIKSEMLADIS
jgi:hypothetical protein